VGTDDPLPTGAGFPSAPGKRNEDSGVAERRHQGGGLGARVVGENEELEDLAAPVAHRALAADRSAP
jgi:hypothetical protein